jgi:hypothetical protein
MEKERKSGNRFWEKNLEDLPSFTGANEVQKLELTIAVKTALKISESVDTLTLSIDRNAKSNDELAFKVHRLNVILTCATVIAAVAAVAGVVLGIIQICK